MPRDEEHPWNRRGTPYAAREIVAIVWVEARMARSISSSLDDLGKLLRTKMDGQLPHLGG